MLKKVKRRYLALKVESDGVFDSVGFIDAVWGAVLRLFGECGASRCGLMLIDYDGERGLAVVRVLLKEVEAVRAAVASITRIRDKPAAVHVLAVSGTIKALHKRIRM